MAVIVRVSVLPERHSLPASCRVERVRTIAELQQMPVPFAARFGAFRHCRPASHPASIMSALNKRHESETNSSHRLTSSMTGLRSQLSEIVFASGLPHHQRPRTEEFLSGATSSGRGSG